jgi:hypothetical protein
MSGPGVTTLWLPVSLPTLPHCAKANASDNRSGSERKSARLGLETGLARTHCDVSHGDADDLLSNLSGCIEVDILFHAYQ